MIYTMTQEDLDKLMEASKPVPLIMLQCGMPTSAQERANDAWRELGARMGFDWETVQPTAFGSPLEFSAKPLLK